MGENTVETTEGNFTIEDLHRKKAELEQLEEKVKQKKQFIQSLLSIANAT